MQGRWARLQSGIMGVMKQVMTDGCCACDCESQALLEETIGD